MTSTVRIYHGTVKEAAAIATMLARLAGELGNSARFSSTQETIVQHGFGPSARFSTQIAETGNGHPVGLVLYFPHFSTTRGKPGVFIQDLWVDPGVRGKEIGATLLAAAAEHASREWGAGYLALLVSTRNQDAMRFYTSLGMEVARGEKQMMLETSAFENLAALKRPDA